VGAQILSHLEVMGPIADLVGQHHERLDGSGYPKGLSGDEILPGARIIAVADVVEAISSHRPYRPALGTKSAICEIVRLRGAAFDADVVDACLRVYELGGLDFLSA
jgi:HD-GYP domain-containing protein (c-di-GMP phosphodiesterase class II)